MTLPFIVAEVSVTWPDSKLHIQQEFEKIINLNWKRGYELQSWQFHQIYALTQVTETIIAVFKRRGGTGG